MKKVAIIGSNSAICKNFIYHYQNEYELYLVGRSDYIKGVKLQTSNLHVLSTKYTNLNEIIDFVKNADVIIYCVGITNGSPDSIQEINIELFKNFLISLPQTIPLIFIGSIAVEMNNDFYSQSKLISEKNLESSGIKYITLRPSVLYGKFDRNNLFKIKNIVRSFPILPLFGDSVTIEPLNLADLSRLLRNIINKSFYNNKAYSLSGAEQIPIDRVIQAFEKQLSVSRIKVYIPLRFIQRLLSIFKPLLPKSLSLIRQLENMKSHPKISYANATKDLSFKANKFTPEDID